MPHKPFLHDRGFPGSFVATRPSSQAFQRLPHHCRARVARPLQLGNWHKGQSWAVTLTRERTPSLTEIHLPNRVYRVIEIASYIKTGNVGRNGVRLVGRFIARHSKTVIAPVLATRHSRRLFDGCRQSVTIVSRPVGVIRCNVSATQKRRGPQRIRSLFFAFSREHSRLLGASRASTPGGLLKMMADEALGRPFGRQRANARCVPRLSA